ncbi:hypothetical protein PHLH8_25160 [Pseudomonas sp. Pc102]|uniref:S49 family peptidase n=1 Tax=Pseudomonas sp. Pc102 TaxID=2678261 RepID=UPI001BCF1BA6|nr:S49 family peptidase [Pseudomonas sp. Pc102]BBP82874.1 hypothetical protein PHLH8_25160 [Pseudomonas sp. Pc102]
MKRYLRASSLLFNQPLLVTPDVLDMGVRWANQTMNLNIVNVGPPGALGLRKDGDDPGAQLERIEERRRARVAQTGIEVIPVHGILVSRGGHMNPCETMTSYDGLRTSIQQAVADPMVERIVLDIDTPGGSATGAFELAASIRAMAQQKPITGIVNFMAFSGGYLIGSACSELVVSQTSGVGSIGVIASHLDRSRMEDRLGVTVTTVYAGAHKNDLTPHEPISEQSLQLLNELVQESYGHFVDAVAEYRGLTAAQVRGTEARTYSGQAGIDAGLADRLQAPQDALDGIARAVATSRAERQNRKLAVRAAALNIQTLI